MQTERLRIGTRGSRLALWQAEAVREALAAAHGLSPDDFEVVVIRTSGDRILDRPLNEVGGKGLFTKEIDAALLDGRIDMAVHSAKDMETALPDGLVIGGYLPREDVRDALIAPRAGSIAGLPEGARIGTASLRREALMRRLRPDLKVELLRGNVQTRLAKVEGGDLDATLLASAGLRRLGMESHATMLLDPEEFPPACGQGAVAVEIRQGDLRVAAMLAPIYDRATGIAVSCERAFLAALDGSCRTPVAGHALIDGETIRFRGMLLAPDGSDSYEAERSGPVADAMAIGREAGEEIRGMATPAFLAALGIG